MRILLTGATGFLGRRVLERLRGHDVTAVVRSAADVPGGVATVVQDLGAPIDTSALPAGIEAVAHLAQSRNFRDFPGGAKEVYAVNTGAAFELLNWASETGVARFVLTSTGGVYEGGPRPLREQDPIRARTGGGALDHYVNCKRAAELMAGSFAGSMITTVLRPFFIYGPGQDQMLVASIAGRILEGSPITVSGDPGMRVNPVYVDDAAAAVVAALESGRPGTFNVAGAETVTLGELARLLVEAAGEGEIEHQPGEPTDLVADIDRMRADLGTAPQTSLHQGAADLVAWLRDR